VNRGWVASDPARLALPDVPEPTGVSRVTGHLYVSPGAPYLLA
ncbi:MAG TPA: SURF1 family protein, partial [Halieaceae bacterium]|nr:SURF1 family protein [Halieaceae bacterium]